MFIQMNVHNLYEPAGVASAARQYKQYLFMSLPPAPTTATGECWHPHDNSTTDNSLFFVNADDLQFN